jgi:tetratricopeptide (TPR) repeat protein
MPPSSRPDLQPQRNNLLSGWDRRWVILLGGVLLAGFILAAYHNTFHVPFLLDDDESIGRNPTIRSFATAFFPPADSGITVSGRPLLNLSLAINYRLGGTNPIGYHVANLLIHFAAALCLLGVVRRTLKLPKLAGQFGADATPLAWLASTLWALHPLQTESVTYIIQRAESLVSLCYLFTLYAFIRAVEKPSRAWAAVAIVVCLLGMAAKEVMATAPLVLFLYDRTFVSGTFGESWRRHRWLHLGLAAGWILLGALIVASGSRGASVGFERVSWLDYALTQTSAIVRYLRLVFWPSDLVFDYGPIVEKTPAVLVRSCLILAPLLVGTAIALKKRPLLGFLGAAFFLILAPSSSVLPVVSQTMAEHRLYLSLAALAIGIVVLLYRISRRYYWVMLVAVAAVLSVVTVNRNAAYRTSLSIWEDTVQKMPDNTRALNNLGFFYLEAGRNVEAINCFSQALDLVPNFVLAICNLGQALINEGAKEVGFQKSFKEISEDMQFGRNRVEIEKLLANEKFIQGMAQLQKAAQLHCNLGVTLLGHGHTEEGMRHLEMALRLDPFLPKAHYHLSNALADAGRTDEAIIHLEAFLKSSPPTAELLSNLGVLYARAGRVDEALAQTQQALSIDPNYEPAKENLARITTYLQSQPAK